MTRDEQRIAIAEACGTRLVLADDGWWDAQSTHAFHRLGTTRDKAIDSLPNFLADLNAMHEAEKVLTDDQQLHYITYLLGRKGTDGMWDLSWDAAYHCTHATASQRAEALLRTLGLWKETTT
jgi:hypothetical protein